MDLHNEKAHAGNWYAIYNSIYFYKDQILQHILLSFTKFILKKWIVKFLISLIFIKERKKEKLYIISSNLRIISIYISTKSIAYYIQEVVPGVFLGPYSAASRSNLQSLLDHGITHIICIRQAIEANFIKPNFPHKFKYVLF